MAVAAAQPTSGPVARSAASRAAADIRTGKPRGDATACGRLARSIARSVAGIESGLWLVMGSAAPADEGESTLPDDVHAARDLEDKGVIGQADVLLEIGEVEGGSAALAVGRRKTAKLVGPGV